MEIFNSLKTCCEQVCCGITLEMTPVRKGTAIANIGVAAS